MELLCSCNPLNLCSNFLSQLYVCNITATTLTRTMFAFRLTGQQWLSRPSAVLCVHGISGCTQSKCLPASGIRLVYFVVVLLFYNNPLVYPFTTITCIANERKFIQQVKEKIKIQIKNQIRGDTLAWWIVLSPHSKRWFKVGMLYLYVWLVGEWVFPGYCSFLSQSKNMDSGTLNCP